MFGNGRIKSGVPVMLGGLLFILFWISPVLFTGGRAGVLDWDTNMQRLEALRQTILRYGQWPGNNPWVEGGQPLLPSSVTSLFSIRGFLALLLGTFWGLRVSILVYWFIGFFGAWKLAGLFWRERHFRLMFSVFTAANPAAAYHLGAGHSFYVFWFMPLVFYYLFRLKEDKWSGLKAGIVFGLAFDDKPVYIVQFGLLILAFLFLWLFVRNHAGSRRPYLLWLMLFIPVVGFLTFYQFATMLAMARDFPRNTSIEYHLGLRSAFRAFLVPITKLDVLQTGWCGSTWELNCYLGVVSTILFMVSFKGGFRWWHAVTVVLFWALVGNDSRLELMYWIHRLPTFSSQLCFSRLRMFIPLFWGIAAVDGLRILRALAGERRGVRLGTILVGIIMVGEVATVSHLIMRGSFSEARLYEGGDQNPDRKFKTIRQLPGGQRGLNLFNYEATRMNIGVLNYGESNLPRHNEKLIKGLEEPGYIGEWRQGVKVVQPSYWSPNRVTFSGLNPGVPLTMNMNPGRTWFNHGAPLFAKYRIIEPDKPFEVMPDSSGCVNLTYRFPNRTLGLVGSAGFLVILFVAVWFMRSQKVVMRQSESAV